jgi:hypothetical protein
MRVPERELKEVGFAFACNSLGVTSGTFHNFLVSFLQIMEQSGLEFATNEETEPLFYPHSAALSLSDQRRFCLVFHFKKLPFPGAHR